MMANIYWWLFSHNLISWDTLELLIGRRKP